MDEMDEKLMQLLREATRIQTWEEMTEESRQTIYFLAALTAFIFIAIVAAAALPH